MIEQAVDAAKGKGSPPDPLRLYWMCTEFHALPDAGGVYDQDYVTMRQMRTLASIYKATERLFGLGDRVNDELTIPERHLLKYLDDLGVLGGIGG